MRKKILLWSIMLVCAVPAPGLRWALFSARVEWGQATAQAAETGGKKSEGTTTVGGSMGADRLPLFSEEPSSAEIPLNGTDQGPGADVLPHPTPAGSASGAEKPPEGSFSLERTLSYGLSHNRLLCAASQQVQAAGQQVRQAQAGFYPRLDSSYSLKHFSDQPFVRISDVEAPISHSTLNRWQFDATQPLFTGFGLTAKLRVSRLGREITEQQMEEVRLDVTHEVQRSFFQVLLAEKLLNVAKETVGSLEVQKRNAEAMFKEGLAARNDVLKADVALAQAIQREKSSSRNVVTARARLNQLLDLQASARLELQEGDIFPGDIPPLDTLYGLADRRRPEAISLDKAKEQTDAEAKAARSRHFPQVSAFAQYYREGKDFLADENDYANSQNAAVGVRVDWNLFEGGRDEAQLRELGYRRLALDERQRDLKGRIQVEVRDAYEQLQVTRSNIVTAEAALQQARENERITTVQYKEQLVIFLEVLNAQVFLSQSKVDYLEALYGYQLARADLERAVGGRLE